jgi:hypothetical protein
MQIIIIIIIIALILETIKWDRHVACMVEVGNAFKITVGISQRMKQFRDDQQVKGKIIFILILKV